MTKIDIISGFLGAGKTTLIKKFIQEALAGEKLVLIENEFGEIGVDGGFLKDAGIEIKEMNSGCICCSLVGDFEQSLKEVVETYQPERIIIEPSGVGKLSDVIKAVEGVDTKVQVKLNNKIVVVNALKCNMYIKNFGEFFINQVENAEAIVLSRTAELDGKALEKTIQMLRTYNEKATMITTPWEQLDGAFILESIEYQHKLEEELLKETEHHHHHGEECGCGGHHHHEEECGCGGHHHHEEECGCGGHHHHEEECGCGGHHHHEEECGCGCGGHHHGEECGCGGHHHHGEECGCGGHHHHEEECGCGGHHHADEIFSTWGIETAKKYQTQDLEKIVEQLENQQEYGMILRAKGMLECENNQWMYFDYVPGEVNVREGSPCTTGKICVIGTNIKEEAIETLFQN